MPARSTECRCAHNFTCGHYLRNAKPYFYTLADGSTLPPPADLAQLVKYTAAD